MNADLIQQFLRFAVVGSVGFAVDAGIVEALKTSVDPLTAQLLAFPVAASVTWWLNRRYTFKASGYSLGHEWLRYILANLLGWSANNSVYALTIYQSALAYHYPVLGVAAGSVAGMLLNFSMSRFVVFKPT